MQYFAKPYEPFCKENLSFLVKYLNSINFDSGFSTLISDSVVHSGIYKHFKFKMTSSETGDLRATFTLAYITQPTRINEVMLLHILNLKQESSFTKSIIPSEQTVTIYHGDNERTQLSINSDLLSQKVQLRDLVLHESSLKS